MVRQEWTEARRQKGNIPANYPIVRRTRITFVLLCSPLKTIFTSIAPESLINQAEWKRKTSSSLSKCYSASGKFKLIRSLKFHFFKSKSSHFTKRKSSVSAGQLCFVTIKILFSGNSRENFSQKDAKKLFRSRQIKESNGKWNERTLARQRWNFNLKLKSIWKVLKGKLLSY